MHRFIAINETNKFHYTKTSNRTLFFYLGSHFLFAAHLWRGDDFFVNCCFYGISFLFNYSLHCLFLFSLFALLWYLLKNICSYVIFSWSSWNNSTIIFSKTSLLNEELQWKLAKWYLFESQVCPDEIRGKIDDFIRYGSIRIRAKYFATIFYPVFDESFGIHDMLCNKGLILDNISLDIAIREFIENTSFDCAKTLVNCLSVERSHDTILFKYGYSISHTTITQTCYELESFLIGSDSFF